MTRFAFALRLHLIKPSLTTRESYVKKISASFKKNIVISKP